MQGLSLRKALRRDREHRFGCTKCQTLSTTASNKRGIAMTNKGEALAAVHAAMDSRLFGEGDNEHPDHQFRIDRRSANRAMNRFSFCRTSPRSRKRSIRRQRIIGNVILKAEVVEQPLRYCCVPIIAPPSLQIARKAKITDSTPHQSRLNQQICPMADICLTLTRQIHHSSERRWRPEPKPLFLTCHSAPADRSKALIILDFVLKPAN